MKILITGGTGFIGRSLVRSLLQSGHQPTILSRRPDIVPVLFGIGASSMASIDDWSPDIRFDAVINLAGEAIMDHRWTPSRKKALWGSRVGLTEQLVQAIARCQSKPSVLVSGSAIGIYGNHNDTVLDEYSPLHGGFGHSYVNPGKTQRLQWRTMASGFVSCEQVWLLAVMVVSCRECCLLSG